MELGLSGKVALIAGGSSGIGLAVAAELAAEGAHVAIGARDPARLAAAASRLGEIAAGRASEGQGEPGRVSATQVDVTSLEGARRWVEAVASDLGDPAIVVVSGGSPPFGPASAFGPEDYQAAVSQVLLPAVTLALAVLPYQRARGWGRILFVASETAVTPIPGLSLSGVTRTALVRFAQGLAAEAGRDNITVNVLAAGSTRTPPLERMAATLTGQGGDVEAALASMGEHSAVGRLGRPEEIAAVAAFLAGERASFVTGAVHLIDGGAGVMGPDMPYVTAQTRGA